MPVYSSLQLPWGPLSGPGIDDGYEELAMRDANRMISIVFMCPKDGTINKVGCYCAQVAGNPPAYNIGLVTVDANGQPTANPAGGSAIETYDFVAAGWVWVTLTTPATVNAGDVVAARVWPGISPPDVDNYAKNIVSLATDRPTALPRHRTFDTDYWSPFGLSAMYDDGEVVAPAYDTLTMSVNVNTGTTPDEVGDRFQVPFDCECYGALLLVYLGAAASDYNVKLYTDAGDLLKSVSLDQSQAQSSRNDLVKVQWDPQALVAGTWYRLCICPTSANSLYPRQLTVNETASRNWWPEGERWYKCYRTDGGAFTDDDTAIMMLALLLDEITIGDGGGAGGGSYGMIVG